MPLSGQTVSWLHRRRVRLSFFLLVRASICSFGSCIFGSYVRDFAFRALRCARIRRSRSARFCDSRSRVLLAFCSAKKRTNLVFYSAFAFQGASSTFTPQSAQFAVLKFSACNQKGQRAKQGQTKTADPHGPAASITLETRMLFSSFRRSFLVVFHRLVNDCMLH